ncbi:MAG TPA: methyltransferase domain-containing protein [Prosthecobacter sp.]
MKQETSMPETLVERRIKAAESSGGTSSGPILDAALLAFKGLQIKGDLLEFGAGTGELLLQLRSEGYPGKMTGADLLPRPERLPEDIGWGQVDLNHPLSFPDESFDVIISTEVVEHLENPRFMAREFWRLLRPFGAVVLTTPNQESIRSLLALLFSGHYVAFQDSCYPAHITALLRKDLQRMFREAGFGHAAFSFTNHGYVPKLTHWTFQQISFGLLKGRWFSDNLVMILTKPPIRPA